MLDASGGRCRVGIVDGKAILAQRDEPGARGQAAALAPMLAAVLAEAKIPARALGGIAVVVGPGSFTGLRAAIGLAHGVAAGAGLPLAGVTVAEALAEALPDLHGRQLWIALESRRDRIFLARDGTLAAVPLEALPPAAAPLALAGNAASGVAERLQARGDDVWLTDARHPELVAMAAVGARRFRRELPWCEPQPLYVDPPEAKLPAGGLRPPPEP